jgi:hypothetical protein
MRIPRFRKVAPVYTMSGMKEKLESAFPFQAAGADDCLLSGVAA